MKEVDAKWAEEAERRIDAYERGEFQAIEWAEVLGRYNPEGNGDG
ncbi:hypothetical protein FE236_13165 [Mariprofundus erugo]|nr:addiction module protein [Mariprofundus erugo]TLS73515.1 hypothetical protein FE236_13165 [Mariprofundus erugo]